MPAGHVKMQGEAPGAGFFGTACRKAIYAARRATRSELNWSGTATVQAISHCWQDMRIVANWNDLAASEHRVLVYT